MTARGFFDKEWEIWATPLPRFDGRSSWRTPDHRSGAAIREVHEAEGDARQLLDEPFAEEIKEARP